MPTPWYLAASTSSSLRASCAGSVGAGERLGRDHPLAAGRRRGRSRCGRRRAVDATACRTGPRARSCRRPSPTSALLADPRLEVAGDERALVDDPLGRPARCSRPALRPGGGSPATGTARPSASGTGGTARSGRGWPRAPSTRTARRRATASAISVRGCGPSRANSGSSWLRTSTLTESIWIRPIRSSTRRRWRRSTRPVGRGSAKPWAARAIRFAWALEMLSCSTSLDRSAYVGIRP